MKLILITLIVAACLAQCPNDELCARCNGNVCELCYRGFAVNGTCKQYTLFLENCWSYAFDGYCQLCAPGYFVNQVGRCETIKQAGCGLYSLTETCIACNNTVRVSNYNCDSGVKCSAGNCAMCNSADSCLWCNDGFALTKNNLCTAVLTAQPNCLALTESGCAQCNYGFFNKNGTCQQSTLYSFAGVLSAAIFGLVSAILI